MQSGDGIMDSINDILSGLTPEDMERLRQTAESIFSSQENGQGCGDASDNSETPDLSGLFNNARLISKISSVMGEMNKKDDRTRLIEALKPLLSEKRRKRADEAMQMMKLFELLPVLEQLTGDDIFK